MKTIKVSNGKDTWEVDEANLGEAQKDGFVPTIKVSNGQDSWDVHPNDLPKAETDGYLPLKDDKFDTRAFRVGLEEGVSFGLRPIMAGAGAGLGAMYGEAEKGMGKGEGISDYLSRIGRSAPSAYQEARKSALAEQGQLSADSPKSYLAGGLASGLLTPPIARVSTFGKALGMGAAQGAGRAISEEKDLKDIALEAGKGMGISGVTYGLVKAVPIVYEKGKQVVGKVTDFIGDKSKKVFIKAANALTGETEKNIKTFIDKHDAVEKMLAESGGDVSVAADTVRQKLQSQIQAFRRSQGAKIQSALDDVSTDRIVSSDSIIDGLERVKSKINVKLKPEEAAQIDELIAKIKDVAGIAGKTDSKGGTLSLKEVFEVQDMLYDSAKGSYLKGGQIFMPGKMSQQAAKSGAREAKIILDQAVPELRQANEALSKLHKIEENINKNLIAPGKSESAILAAGGATAGRNRLYLKEMGNILGKDVVGEAENLSAAAAFGNPNIMPKSSGGTTSTSRTLISGALGTIFGGPVGGVVGAVITSPLALKQAINAGMISKPILEKVIGTPLNFADQAVIQKALQFVNSPQGMTMMTKGVQSMSNNSTSAIQRRMNQIQGEK